MCITILNENTCRIVYKNTCITLTEILSEIGVYSIIPTLATFSDTHAD